MTSKNPYRIAGMGGVYVEREADIRLRRELSDNRRFPLLTAPPESGKTSLIKHTIDSLDQAGFCVLSVDLSRLRLGNSTQFMGELLGAIAREGDFDQREILPDNPEDSILAWMGTFPQRLVIFLDNCEVLDRPELSDAVFGKLRLLYNIRNENEEFSRLQVILAGAVSGRRLIPIHLQAPFGVGAEILLRPFNAEQVDALSWHLSTAGVTVSSDVGSRLTHHSGGLPFLCQQVLSSLWEEAVIKGTMIDTADVDRAVDDLIERAPQIEHFANLFRTFSSDQDLLDAFNRLCRGQSVSEEMLTNLTLTGLCEEDLPFRSMIYERVFGRGGPLAFPSPVGQRPTVQVAVISGAESSEAPSKTARQDFDAEADADAIEVNPDEDSGFLVLSEPPPPKPQPVRPQFDVDPPSAVPASSVPAPAPVPAPQPLAAEPPPASTRTPTYGVVATNTATAAAPTGPQSNKTPTYGIGAPTTSTQTPTYAATLSQGAPPPSQRTPAYVGTATGSQVPSERTPTYAGMMMPSSPPSSSTPRYPMATGSMPAVPVSIPDAPDAASNKTPLYNPSMTPPVPSQRTPTYPSIGSSPGSLPGMMSGPASMKGPQASGPTQLAKTAPPPLSLPNSGAVSDDIDDRPTQMQTVAPRSETQELRLQIDAQIMLSAELDLFCSTYFPHVARLFNSPLSRAEKTDLLLAHVERSLLRDRLKDWAQKRRETRPEAYSNSSTDSISPLPSDVVVSQSAPVLPPLPPVVSVTPPPLPVNLSALPPSSPPPPPPPAAMAPLPPPPPTLKAEVPASLVASMQQPDSVAEVKPVDPVDAFKPASTASLQVGIGLVLANRYFLTSEIGQGAVATMWNAYDRIKDEQVALKILHGAAADNPQLVERFWRSAQQMAGLSHPTVVGVLNKPREENGTHYVVLELQAGGNLRQWVQGGKLTRMQLMRTLQRLGAALSYAHDRKVFHRDIKPTNILFDAAGHARLTDFAMVWPADAALRQESRVDRTVYIAPEEQAGGHLGDARSDVYSLGMCALYALYGKELTPQMVMDRAGLIDSLDAPPPLKAVLLRAVAPNPNDRFPSVAEFCRALEFDAPALPGMVTRGSLPGLPANLTRTNPGLIAPGMRQSSPQMPVMAPLSRTNPPINPSLTRTNPGLFGGQAPPLTSPAKPSPVRTTGPQQVGAGLRTTNPGVASPAAGLRNTNPPMPGLTRTSPPPLNRPASLEEELQPPQGRSPGELAEYAIDTERVRAVTAEATNTRSPNPVIAPLPPPNQPQRQWPLMVGFGVLVLAGGIGLGTYLVNATRKPTVATTDPATRRDNAGGSQVAVRPAEGPEEPFVATPIIPVKPGEAPPSKGKHDAGKAHPTEAAVKVVKPEDEKPTAVAKTTPGEKDGLEKPAQRPALLKPVAAKTDEPAHTEPKPLLAKVESAKPAPVAAAKPEVKPEVKVVAAVKPEVKVVAAVKPEAKVVAAVKPEVKPVAAVKPEVKPVAAVKPEVKPVAVVKPAPVAAKPVAVAAKPVAVAAKPVAVAAKPVAVAAKPAPSAAATPEGQAMLRDAQQAYIRGDRQQALAMALGVTRRGGEDAANAWRFVGGAACSNRQASLATTAYRNLKSPDARRTLVDLCQRNGLPFAAGQFSSD